MSSLNYSNLIPFIGIPWARHGRDYDGADCLGLVYLYYRDLLGVEIQQFGAKEMIRDLDSMYQDVGFYDGLIECDLQDNAICVFRTHKLALHIAVYIGNGKILHSPIKKDSLIEDLSLYNKKYPVRYYAKS